MPEDDTKTVGVVFKKSTNDILTLRALIHSSGKSKLIRTIVEQHIDYEEWTLEDSAAQYAGILVDRWFVHWRGKADFESYLSNQRTIMKTVRGVSDELITLITEKCRELQKELTSK